MPEAISTNVSTILVEPQGPLNIGSICRTMMNFGFSDLRLVNPCVDYNSPDSQKMALKAKIILNNAKIFTSLKDALSDCHASFGTSRRFGKSRTHFLLPSQAAEKFPPLLTKKMRVAVVFGREDCGLHTEELDLCNAFISIPTDENYGSMNLAQAAAVCLYEIRKTLNLNDFEVKNKTQLCSTDELENLYEHMQNTFLKIGLLETLSPEKSFRIFRRIFGRAHLSTKDVRVLRGMCSKIDALTKKNICYK